MTDKDEALREALLELKLLREREAAALRESNALLAGLSGMNAAESPDDALPQLFATIRSTLGCDAVVLLSGPRGKGAFRHATDPSLDGLILDASLGARDRPLRLADTHRLGQWEAMPAAIRPYHAMLSVPLALPGEEMSAILCFSRSPATFAPGDARLLQRLSALAAQGLATLQLAERNALLASVIDGSSASVSIADATDDELPLIYVNDAFLALSGYDREFVLGQNCRLLTAEPAGSPERVRLAEAVAARASGTFTLLNRRRDGGLFWNRLTLFPVTNRSGQTTHLVATQTDITAERAAAEERDTARRQLVAALSATSEGFLVVDPAGAVIFANAAYRDFFDETGTLFVEGNLFVTAWERRLMALGVQGRAVRGAARARLNALFGQTSKHEAELPDGRILLINDRPTEDGGAVSIATDITALKASERVLAQRAAAIDATQDGIAVTDEHGRFVYMNPAHLALFGYESEAEVLGRPWSMLYTAPNAERIERDGMPALMASGRWRAEIPGLRRDGTTLEQEVSLNYLAGIGIVCVTRDVGERRQAERERARLRDQLQTAQRREAVGQLAAGVAHDFNNLLSVVSTSVALLKLDRAQAIEQQEHLDRISSATERASALVGRLMDLGAREVELRRVDMRAVVREAIDLLRAGMPGTVELSAETPSGPIEVDADPTEMLQIILNFGINARDALEGANGSVGLRLHTASYETAPPGVLIGAVATNRRYGVIEVSDTGTGMSREALRGIFKPYYTTKGDDGTGLGLVVVSTVANKIDGAVAVSSTPGRGSTFRFFWPLERDENHATPVAAAAVQQDVDLAGKLVLVCDDIPDVGRTIAALLEQAGAEVAVCEDPRDALEAVRDDPASWSLLITDFDMPFMTGAELAEAVRVASPELPILLCSALAEARRHAAHVDAILSKPVTSDSLRDAVSRAMLSRRGSD
ncbi:MAG: PAS domain-containing protein [Pseudomonadota bacterium]